MKRGKGIYKPELNALATDEIREEFGTITRFECVGIDKSKDSDHYNEKVYVSKDLTYRVPESFIEWIDDSIYIYIKVTEDQAKQLMDKGHDLYIKVGD